MNKYLFPIVSIVLVGTLTGCFGGSSDVSDQSLEKTLQGELQKLPSSISELDVTHVLITESRERVYLRSIMFDLDLYDKKKVRLSGVPSEEDLSDKPVNILTVEKIDLLDSSEVEDLVSYESEELGIKFNYDRSRYNLETSSTRIILSDVETSDVISVKIYKASPEQDALKFISNNYSSSKSEKLSVSNAYSFFNKNDSSIIVDNGTYFYELMLVGFDLVDIDEKETLMLNFLDSLTFISVKNAKLESNLVEVDSIDTVDSNTNEKLSNSPTPASSKFTSVIENFESKVANYLPSFKSAISYSFTSDNKFYVVYLDSDSNKSRVLLDYTNDKFVVLAEFKPGDNTDWELVTGNNSAANKPLTLVMVNKSSGNREISLVEGYRYFESIPLGFGLQYPQSWYYSRVNDSYIFSNKPISVGDVLIKAEVIKSEFTNVSGEKVSDVIKKSISGGSISYFVDLGKSYIKISGSADYIQQIETMAKSVEVLN